MLILVGREIADLLLIVLGGKLVQRVRFSGYGKSGIEEHFTERTYPKKTSGIMTLAPKASEMMSAPCWVCGKNPKLIIIRDE